MVRCVPAPSAAVSTHSRAGTVVITDAAPSPASTPRADRLSIERDLRGCVTRRTALTLLCVCLAGTASARVAQRDSVVALRVRIVDTNTSLTLVIPDGERGQLELEEYGSFTFLPTIDTSDASHLTVQVFTAQSTRPLAVIDLTDGGMAVAVETSPAFELSVRVHRLQ